MEKRMANHHPHDTMSSFHTTNKPEEYQEEKKSSSSRARERFNTITSNRPSFFEEEEKESSSLRSAQRINSVTSNRLPFSVEEEVKESPSSRVVQRLNTVNSNKPPSSQLKPKVSFNEEDYDSKRRANLILKREIDIDRSAEDFINRFKQQLQIERLDSIENYKQYLERGL